MSQARKNRGIAENIFLIEMFGDDDTVRKYVVRGSSSNIYYVTIKNIPECTCPDYLTRSNRCKHIYFVLIRVMKVTDVDKKMYDDDELKIMFKNVPAIMSNLIVSAELKLKYENIKNNDEKKVEKKETDDICPICLDDLENGEQLDFCKYSCGKHIHMQCHKMWTQNKTPTCVFCRSDWEIVKQITNDGYIKLI